MPPSTAVAFRPAVIYPAAKDSPADVLPELLTKDIVLTALIKDAK